MYFHMNQHLKKVMKSQKMVKVEVIEQRYFVIYIRSPLKMQKILKQSSSSYRTRVIKGRALDSRIIFWSLGLSHKRLKKLSFSISQGGKFAFMKFFDSLVKITIFWAFLLFFGRFVSRVLPRSSVRLRPQCMTQISQKVEKCPKNGYFD